MVEVPEDWFLVRGSGVAIGGIVVAINGASVGVGSDGMGMLGAADEIGVVFVTGTHAPVRAINPIKMNVLAKKLDT
jgi:hypothetical protein